jgi:regulator of cell morphogenesis and NO signaling
MVATQEQTVSEIAVENPSGIRVFETLGIDYCCGGKRSLSEACSRVGITTDHALALLSNAGRGANAPVTNGWANLSLSAIVADIVVRHHSYVRRETPRLESLFEKVISRHGVNHPEVGEIRQLFDAMSQELATHMLKEEQVLFPHIAHMEEARQQAAAAPTAFFGSVANPIANMAADHDDAGALLAKIRELTNNFTPPEGACPTFRALWQGLQEFESDLHRHVHLENNILFPRAITMERGN